MEQLILELAPAPAPTIENFVPGRNGAALQAVADLLHDEPAERFVYLWGEPGCGRSHLLRAASAACTGNPSRLIIADDVQRLTLSDQIALFDRYNHQHATGGRLLAAGDRAPRDLVLRDDLKSRLAWGLVFELHPLSEQEIRVALRAHAQARGMQVGEDILDYLLRRLRRDMATQAAVLDALDRYSLRHKRPLSLPLVREALQRLGT